MKTILGLEFDGETLGVELGFDGLQNIIYYIPDTEENTQIFSALAKHPSAGVRAAVADKQNLDDETVMLLADDNDPNVSRGIPYNETFKNLVTLEQIKKMLEKENDASINIINYAGTFMKVSVEEVEQAIKDADIKDPVILMEAARSYDLSSEYIEELTQHPDVSVANAAKETLKNR